MDTKNTNKNIPPAIQNTVQCLQKDTTHTKATEKPSKSLSPKVVCDIEQSRHQRSVLKALFPKFLNPRKKVPYTLTDWHQQNSTDLALFLAMGFISKLEYSYFNSRMTNEVISDPETDMVSLPPIDGHANPILDEPTFKNLLRRFDFDKHENLLLRMQKPLALMKELDAALLDEAIRSDRDVRRNVTEELLLDNTRPTTEEGCWIEMNRMVGSRPYNPFDISLVNANKALSSLNLYHTYYALANIYDYSNNPIVKQRNNSGHLVDMYQSDVQVRIQTALNFLEEKGLIDHENLATVIHMTSAQRDAELLEFKRDAVTSFFKDMINEAPSGMWRTKLTKAFSWYFHDLLEITGHPSITASKKHTIQAKNGKITFRSNPSMQSKRKNIPARNIPTRSSRD